jgi:NSS family neurotransmitter:Na+ symporter
MHTRTHERWGSQVGFVLAAIGSAAGLGNPWRFSYIAGEKGGAVFLIIYVACVLLLGIPLIVAELAVGRRAHSDAVAAFATSAGGLRWGLVGAVGVMSACLVLSFYGVVAGWALMYFWGALDGTLWAVMQSGYESFFTEKIAAGWRPAFWHLMMMMAAGFVVPGGVRAGIEAFNKVAMPTLLGIVLILAAMGQAFFSLMVSLFVGWKWQATEARAGSDLTSSPLGPVWLALVRFFAPTAILPVLLQGLAIL